MMFVLDKQPVWTLAEFNCLYQRPMCINTTYIIFDKSIYIFNSQSHIIGKYIINNIIKFIYQTKILKYAYSHPIYV